MIRNIPLGPNKEHSLCGVVQHAQDRRAKRRSKPQPWIVLKLAMMISFAMIVYVSYVYIGKFCVPMLKREPHALGSLALGIIFLVVFSVLLIMALWSYLKVAVTSPGFAKDYVERTPRPLVQQWGSNIDVGGIAYEYQGQVNPPPLAHISSRNMDESRESGPNPHYKGHSSNDRTTQEPKHNRPQYSRRPPMTPVLLPEHRYCSMEGFVKPARAHHCRACGYCVLRYDHHCPWIGQCVGAQNHKFFMNFLQWSLLFCVWMFATLIGLNVRDKSISVDPQEIVSMALSGVFGLFSGTMLAAHVRMICLNVSTVENVRISDMEERESALLGQMFSFWQTVKKRRTRKKWDEEWGRLRKEGNIWWMGDWRKNWESIMGKNVWWWFLPIGRSTSDGLEYPVNPRFDHEGRWRRRPEWPDELR